jgi:regulator of protease activity HflC (stomatin/prohibitin superfamily)
MTFLILGTILGIVLLGGLIGGLLTQSAGAIGAAVASALVLLLVWVGSSVLFVSAGTVAVPTFFGKVEPETFQEGARWVNPIYSFEHMATRQRSVELKAEYGVAITQDQTALNVDVGFNFSLQPGMAWKVYQRIGDDTAYYSKLMVPSAQSALRDAIAQFAWADAATDARDKLSTSMQRAFSGRLHDQLVSLGFSDADAKAAFEIMPVQLRQTLPPKQITDAVALRLAAVQDLERQRTLTQIAEQVAARREQEGIGVQKLFSALPKGFTAEQIAIVLHAMAAKERGDAMMKAAESEKVTALFMEGGAAAVPASR